MSGPIKRLPRWLDRAGFEADKLVRINRVKTEAARAREQADARTLALGELVVAQAAAGTDFDPSLRAVVEEILALRADITQKEEEIKAIGAEQWAEPSAPPLPAPAPDPIAQRLQAYVESKSLDFNCPKCGSTIRSSATFCPNCGRKVIRSSKS